MFDLTGKTALITGASGGIGNAIAQALHAQGANLILSGTREAVLQEMAARLGGNTRYVTCNLADKEAVGNLFAEAEKLAEAPVNILVCNAGMTRDTLALRMKNEDFTDILDINLTSTFILNRAAIKSMMRNKWGRIINISSIVAVTGNPGQANYVASKAGMIGMSKALAAESASRGITVNCIAPGFIATPMTDVLSDEQKEKLIKTIPSGKLGQPEDIASGVAYLASEEAGYVNGQTLHINGGMAMI